MAELRESRDGWDEDGGGEEEANGEFFGEALEAGSGVDEEEPGGEEDSEGGVEVECGGIEAMEGEGERYGGEEDDGDERAAVAVVKAVTLFEVCGSGAIGVGAGVEEAVGSVEHPDGKEHGKGAEPGKMDSGAMRDEGGPDGSDRGGVKRKKMP